MTLQFFQPPTSEGLPNLSTFCAKTQIMLEQSGVPFEIRNEGDPTKGPKNKIPYIIDTGSPRGNTPLGDTPLGDTPLGDSYFIEQHLLDAYGVDFYAHVPARERAIAKLVQAAIEEKLYWVMVYSRWQIEENWSIMKEILFGHLPDEIRKNVSEGARKNAVTALWGHGMGRHSKEEAYAIGREIIDNLAEMLGPKTHFVGDTFTSLDASAYGALINLVQNPVPTPLKAHIVEKPELRAFLDAMSRRYFPNALITEK